MRFSKVEEELISWRGILPADFEMPGEKAGCCSYEAGVVVNGGWK